MKLFILGLLASTYFMQVCAQSLIEVQKLTSTIREHGDWFGYHVSISGDYAIIGASYEDEDEIGGDSMSNAGAAYMIERDSQGIWQHVQKIVASDRERIDNFGRSVSISGNYAIVGAHQTSENEFGLDSVILAGGAYIFLRDSSGSWNQIQKIVSADREAGDQFGRPVAIDGDYAIIGAYWEDEDAAGGNTLATAGSAYIFEKDSNGTWLQVQKIVAPDRAVGDRFAESVAISGNYAIAGTYHEQEDTSGSNSMVNAGSCYIFERDSIGQWSFVQKLVASDRGVDDNFGQSVAISGNYVLVGAPDDDEDAMGGNTMNDAGSSYIFERDGNGDWHEVQKLVGGDRGGNDAFGEGVSIDGDMVLIGAAFDNKDSAGMGSLPGAGSAYVFKRDSIGSWNQIQKLVASDRQTSDGLGESVSISGSNIVLGARFEDHDINGLIKLSNPGSVYMFGKACVSTVGVIDPESCYTYVSPSGVYTWDTSGVYYDTINNIAGCDSLLTINLTIKEATTGSISPHACGNYSSPSDRYNWDSAGTYFDTIQNAHGCDSVITIHLTLTHIDVSVTLDTVMIGGKSLLSLIANDSTADAYQWLDEWGLNPIPGATNRRYTPPDNTNGGYYVEITKGECVDTSAWYHLDQWSGMLDQAYDLITRVYPNPNQGSFTIDLGKQFSHIKITTLNSSGQTVNRQRYKRSRRLQLEIEEAKGVYILEVVADGKTSIVRVVKE